MGDGEDGCPVEDSGAGTLDTDTGPVHSLGGDSLQHTQLTLQQRSLPNKPSSHIIHNGLGVGGPKLRIKRCCWREGNSQTLL